MNILQSFGAKPDEEPVSDPRDFISDSEIDRVNNRREERAAREPQFVITGSDGTGLLRRLRKFPQEVIDLFPEKKPGYLFFLDGVWKVNYRGNFEIVSVNKPIWLYPGIKFGYERPSYTQRKRGEPNGLPHCDYCGRTLFWRDMDGGEFCGLCWTPRFWNPDFNVLIREWFLKG